MEYGQQKKLNHDYLQQLISPVKKFLHNAYLFALGSLILCIVQYWLIADLLAHILNIYLFHIPFSHNLFLRDLIFVASCLLVRPFLQYFRELKSQQASLDARLALHNKLIDILQQSALQIKTFGSDGILSTKLIDQVDALDAYISRYYVQTLLTITAPILIIGIVFFYSKVVVIIFIVTIPLMIIFMILVGSTAADKSRKQFDTLAHLSSHFLDLLRGMKTILLFNANDQAKKVIYQSSEQYRKGTMDVLKLAFLSVGVLEFFSSISIAGIALYLGLGLLGEIPIHRDTIFISYQGALFILLLAPEFYAPLRILGNDYHAKTAAEGAIAELIPILQYQSWIHPGQQSIQLSTPPYIKVHNLSITANGIYRLKPISFAVQSAQRILIQGESGSGKSSLIDALLGFVPYEGSIFINQDDFLHISRQSWLKHVGYLSQQPKIIDMSIKDNLLLAKRNASDAELFLVLQEVGLLDLIMNLPDQLNTMLGERGLGLSGGQLSRLSIAQLLLKDSLIWLIDEPTEHLDRDSAELIWDLLAKLSQGKTVLFITHYQGVLSWIDNVVKLEK